MRVGLLRPRHVLPGQPARDDGVVVMVHASPPQGDVVEAGGVARGVQIGPGKGGNIEDRVLGLNEIAGLSQTVFPQRDDLPKDWDVTKR